MRPLVCRTLAEQGLAAMTVFTLGEQAMTRDHLRPADLEGRQRQRGTRRRIT
jgi:hypothetical protein